jgi:DNA modification methylase
MGRNFIGIEIDPTYFEIAVRRIKAELEQKKLEL